MKDRSGWFGGKSYHAELYHKWRITYGCDYCQHSTQITLSSQHQISSFQLPRLWFSMVLFTEAIVTNKYILSESNNANELVLMALIAGQLNDSDELILYLLKKLITLG